MSGATLPYSLRPNKFIDRQLFADVLKLVLAKRGRDKYVYLSMGGAQLADHKLVYRQIGLRSLYSFDTDDQITRRQRFNRPAADVRCETHGSDSVPSILDSIKSIFPESENFIVWLDYTSPHERLTQLQELVEVSKRCLEGDIVRITMNANMSTLEGRDAGAWKAQGYEKPGQWRADLLRGQIAEFFPADIASLNETALPSALCRACELAFVKASKSLRSLQFVPILCTSYRDGQKMVTVTALCVNGERRENTFTELKDWDFLPSSWSDVSEIVAPDLSVKEKLWVDASASDGIDVAEISSTLGFYIEESAEKSKKVLESYLKFSRYYPMFQHIEF